MQVLLDLTGLDYIILSKCVVNIWKIQVLLDLTESDYSIYSKYVVNMQLICSKCMVNKW